MNPWPVNPGTDWEDLQTELIAAGWSDGLPLVPPTPERVARMLRAAKADAMTVVAAPPPLFAPITLQDIAINAVMAGCPDGCLPVVAAAVAAIADDAFNLLGVATTTGSATPALIVNGPVAAALEMNAGANALGPGNRANATIGRALRLILQNAAGARPGETDMATLGQPGKYTFCFAENEADNPWEPLHAERGFERTASVVTAIGVSGTIEIVDSESITAADLARTITQSMLLAGNIGSSGMLGGGEPLIILPPEHANVFAREGYTKLQVKEVLYESARLPVASLSTAMQERLARRGSATGPDSDLRIAERPQDIMIVVAGGVGRKAAYVPSWSGYTRAVSRLIPPVGA